MLKKNQYLMSHLQKCVRRMETKKAVQTAKHLIDLDIHSFLRRLPIIMVEDVCYMDSFIVLIWMIFYYGRSGLFADIALSLNILSVIFSF